MKKLAKQFLGFSIAAIGVLWILNVTGVIGFDIFFHGWWTLLIILPCTAHLIANPNWGSFSGIALGAVLLLQAQATLTGRCSGNCASRSYSSLSALC